MVDLELLHNFTTFTYATISSDPAVRQMFKTTAIRMSLDCEYLMRTILGLSALHIAHFRRDKADVYINVAMDHHRVACRLAISVMDHLDNLGIEDVERLHLFSVLTLFFGKTLSFVTLFSLRTMLIVSSPRLAQNRQRYSRHGRISNSQLADYAPRCRAHLKSPSAGHL